MAILRALAIAGLLSTASQAWADFDATAYPAYERCALCHDLFGNSARDKFPKLAGQKPAYLEAQIRAFISGDRTNDNGQMASIVTELLPEEIEIVVEWFSTQDPPPPAILPRGNTGQSIVERLGCTSCHGTGNNAEAPHLTAQHSAYLSKQMRDFRDGRRSYPGIAQMHQRLLAAPDTEIDEIAAYLAALERQE